MPIEQPNPNPISMMVIRFASGDHSVENELFSLIYKDLRHIAALRLRGERKGHSLQATELVHEAFLRMAVQAGGITGRLHFFALASKVMRQILVDHARAKLADKRGGEIPKVSFDDAVAFYEESPEQGLLLDSALKKLAEKDPREAQIVEMRFYAELTEEEIGLVLGVSSRTVKRNWQHAKQWLKAELISAQGQS